MCANLALCSASRVYSFERHGFIYIIICWTGYTRMLDVGASKDNISKQFE